MTKKSLFLGAAAVAALSLLVLFAFVGCSNPSSSDTAYVSQAASDYPYPADTVFVAGRDALEGLLNEYSAETNQVRNIAYTGASNELAGLIIRNGKTVYLTEPHTSAAIGGNITVREGTKLVLVGDFTAGGGGALLVRGEVEVFRHLTVTADARDVADYSVENEIFQGRNTVIGKNVTILPGAVLILHVDDIIPPHENQPNKFTPAQAWAAAGQGHLVIGINSDLRDPDLGFTDALPLYNYTVAELLSGVVPSANRTYTVTSGRSTAEELPALIPQGTFILTHATPEKSVGNSLTVNGWLSTDGTLNEITRLEVGNSGTLLLTEPNRDLLKGLTNLKLGPGANLTVTNDDVSLEALDTLFLGDGSSIVIPGTNVTFKLNTPLDLTVGKNIVYQVGMSPSAALDTVVSKDAGLVGGSTLIVYPGSTFKVEPGVTFTVDGASVFDISQQPIPPTGDTAPIEINGTIEIAALSTFIGPDFATVQADPAALYETINLGADGKVVLNDGAIFQLGNVPNAGLVGPSAGNYAYEWAGNDGGEIEINTGGLVIRNTNSDILSNPVEVTIAEQGAGILKDQSLTLERGVTLTIDQDKALYLFGDAAGGAKLLGPGILAAGTTSIVGGEAGWQVIGHNIVISPNAANDGRLFADSLDPSVTTPEAILQAQGLNADIEIEAAGTLDVWNGVTIDLNGTISRKNGAINLTNTAVIILETTSSKILTGAADPATAGLASAPLEDSVPGTSTSTGGSAPYTLATIGVTGLQGDTNAVAVTTAAFDTTNNKLPVGNLVSLGYDTAASVITATANVVISSETKTGGI
jgi:hypothetical protein